MNNLIFQAFLNYSSIQKLTIKKNRKGERKKMKLKFNTTVLKLSLAAIILSVILIGCAENDQKDFEIHEGYFEDSAVQGLKYKTITNEGMTDKSGKFYYCTGELITFYVGDIKLGESAEAKSYMTPKDLVPQDKGNPEQNKLLIARFLQTLDSNNNPKDGITIDEKIHEKAVKTDSFDPEKIIFIADEKTGVTPTSSTVTFSACEQSLYSSINLFKASAIMPITTTVVNENDAKAHLIAAETKQDQIEKGLDPTSKINPKISVYRDDMGVWFINGPDDVSLYDVFYEVGYQVATDRLWQLEQYRRAATGKLAELLGETYLENDIFVRTLGYSQQELEDGFNELDEDSKNVINGYVDGINHRIDYVMDNRSQMPMEYVALGAKAGVDIVPIKWTVSDLLAWNALLQRQFDPEALEVDHGQLENIQLLGRLMEKYPTDISAMLGQNPGTTLVGQVMFADLRWTDDPDAQTYILDEDVPDEWKNKRRKRMNTTVSIPQIPDYSDTISKLQQFRRRVKNNLERINANVKMGSYAWVVGPEKTRDGKPIIYAGPQMGFDSPNINIECSIEAGGLRVSGLMIPGIPGVILGRTPHHAWSMQVGHVHSTDFYFDFDKNAPVLVRQETIGIAGKDPVTIPVYKINNRPVIQPLPFIRDSYIASSTNPIVSWRYSHVGHEFNMVSAMLDLAKAESINEFGKGIEKLGLSQHFCYADKDGNIAYWMSGRDPKRPDNPYYFGYQLPQGYTVTVQKAIWDDNDLKERSKSVNPSRHYFAGWNNKSHPYYSGSPNNVDYFTGPFHRSHIIYDYLDKHNDLTFEDVRDLAIYISTTESIGKAGNPWPFVKELFSGAVASNPTNERQEALTILNEWDGHFIDGGKANWATGKDRSDGWMLMDTWVRTVIAKTFSPYSDVLAKADDSEGDSGAEGDEDANLLFGNEYQRRLLNVIIRSFKGRCNYDWFNSNMLAPPESPYYTALAQNMKNKAFSIIVEALDETLSKLGARPWGIDKRGFIEISNGVLSQLVGDAIPGWKIWRIPFGSRSTYAQCVQLDNIGPDRIESFFPLGQSTQINWSILLSSDPNRFLKPKDSSFYHEHFFDMSTTFFDNFVHREFPLFK
jgi:penicillin amidase